jgi:hypothetical protein
MTITLPEITRPFTLWASPHTVYAELNARWASPPKGLEYNWRTYAPNSRADVFPFTDEKSLVSARRLGSQYAIRVYDDGYGPLWIHRDSMGITGIVRAWTWEDAYSICEDEFFPGADETVEEFEAEYGENWPENDLFCEAYGFRPNGRNSLTDNGIYVKDMNCEALDELTSELAADLELVFTIETES